jgi:hypothetical protein
MDLCKISGKMDSYLTSRREARIEDNVRAMAGQ